MDDNSNYFKDIPKCILLTERHKPSCLNVDTMNDETFELNIADEDTVNALQIINPRQDLIVQLCKMGFPIDKVELAVFFIKKVTIEEALKFLIKDSHWEHPFISNEIFQRNIGNRECLLCAAKANKTIDKPPHESLKYAIKTTNGYLLTNNKEELKREEYKYTSNTFDEEQKSSLQLEDNTCAICGDYNHLHKPIYNHTTSESILNTKACLICFEESKTFITLNCQHKYCYFCFKEYLKYWDKSRKLIMCPMYNCYCAVQEKVLISIIGLKAYNEYINEINRINGVIDCPFCSVPNKLIDAEVAKVRCSSCYSAFCARCKTKWHIGKSCSTYIDRCYDYFCTNRKIQLCPQCKELVKRAPYCGHMMCSNCLLEFCIRCRKRISNDMGASCSLHYKKVQHRTKRSKLYVVSIALLLLILYFLLFPLVALLLLPYIVALNVFNYFCEEVQYVEHPRCDYTREQHSVSTILQSKPQIAFYKHVKHKCNIKAYLCSILAAFLTILIYPVTFIALSLLGLFLFVKAIIIL